MRRSTRLLLFLALTLLLFVGSFVDVFYRQSTASTGLQHRSQLVAELGLTDLALFTEARYTRHLSQSDLHSAFQDHPHAFEHFPSGSLVSPRIVGQ